MPRTVLCTRRPSETGRSNRMMKMTPLKSVNALLSFYDPLHHQKKKEKEKETRK